MKKATFDANIWYSAVRGGSIAEKIPLLIDLQKVKILTCQSTVDEYNDITTRPKAKKILLSERISVMRDIIHSFTEILPTPFEIESISRDVKDDYLLAFSKEYGLDYLVTGDKDLLVLKTYSNTQICTFADFIAILEKQSLI